MPVISVDTKKVDTKKKELIGPYKNAGKQWQPQGEATPVLDHDFPAPDVPRAYPYGIYDVGRNRGFVSIGTDHDTATLIPPPSRSLRFVGGGVPKGESFIAEPRVC